MSYFISTVSLLLVATITIGEAHVCVTPECVDIAGRLLTTLGTARKGGPCEDMYSFSCANYIRPENLVPGAYIQSGMMEMEVKMANRLNYLLAKDIELTDANADPYSAEAKVKLFYKSCMEAVHDPQLLRTILQDIGSWPLDENWNQEEYSLERAIATTMSFSSLGEISGLMKLGVSPDLWDNTRRILYVAQPEKSILEHIPEENTNSTERDDYISKFISIAQLAGATNEDQIRAYSRRVWELEVAMARLINPGTMLKPLAEIFRRMKIGWLGNRTRPGLEDKHQGRAHIDYRLLFSAYLERELSYDDEIIIGPQNYLNDISEVLVRFTPDEIAVYNAWRLLRAVLMQQPDLPKQPIAGPIPEMKTSSSSFKVDKPINGKLPFLKQIANNYNWLTTIPQHQRCTTLTNSVLRFATAAMYVRYYEIQEDKAVVEEMLREIIDYFPTYIDGLHWLDPITRQKAKEKAANSYLSVGYPDWIMNDMELDSFYFTLLVTPKYSDNLYNMALWNHRKGLQLYDEKATRYPWEEADFLPPLTINAGHSLEKNAITIFTGILEKPYYYRYPKSVLYGTLGYIIGHEIFHGYDVRGRWHDANGNIADWWEDRAEAEFVERSECFRRQYDALSVNGIPTNGEKVLGESTSDNGGLALAFGAYQRWRHSQTEEALKELDPLLPGLNMTHAQQFFLAFGQIYCQQELRPILVYLWQTDVHPQSIARTNGALVNSPTFADVFHCDAHTPMNPPKKCKLW